MKPQEYQQLVKENQPPRHVWKNVLLAFLVSHLLSGPTPEFVAGWSEQPTTAAVTLPS